MAREIYPWVTLHATKSFTCSSCGKPKRRSTTFRQTINPFNRTAQGHEKTKTDILKELAVERERWLKKPILCAACEELSR